METVELIFRWLTILIFVSYALLMSICKKYKKLISFFFTLSVLIMMQLIIFVYRYDFLDLRPVFKYGFIVLLIYIYFSLFRELTALIKTKNLNREVSGKK